MTILFQRVRILEMYPINHFIKIGIDNWSSKTKGGVGGTGVNSRMTETGYEEHDLSYNVNHDESKELDDLDVEEDEYDEDSKLTVGMHESKPESVEAMLAVIFTYKLLLNVFPSFLPNSWLIISILDVFLKRQFSRVRWRNLSKK